MELNVFTEQLEKCYNILAQQFVLIKQLKDLTTSDKTNTEDIETIKTNISLLQNQLNTVVNDYVGKDTFEKLVEATPTDVRVVKDQDKWQLQLEHDTKVLSIDEGLQTALSENSGKLYVHNISARMEFFIDDGFYDTVSIPFITSRATPYTQLDDLATDHFFILPVDLTLSWSKADPSIDPDENRLIAIVGYVDRVNEDIEFLLIHEQGDNPVKSCSFTGTFYSDEVVPYSFR